MNLWYDEIRKEWYFLRKRLLHFFLALFFLWGIQSPFHSHGADDVYFIGVNNVVIPMKASNLPIWVDGFMCLPYTVFDASTAGSSLGISSTYQRSNNLATVYNGQNTLIFDIDGGYCINGATQAIYHQRGVVRDGIPYLPMTLICDFFQISYSYHRTDHGYLVRLEKSTSNWNISRFLQENYVSMERMLYEYKYGPLPPEPSVTVVPEPEEPDIQDTPLCIAFEVGEDEVDMTSVLENWKIQGVFFFTEEQLKTQGNYVRKLIAMGHSIGFRTLSDSSEGVYLELERCNTLLFSQTRSESQIVWVPSWAESGLQGYIPWQVKETKELTQPQTVVRGLKQEVSMAYLLLAHNETSQNAWSQLMNALGEKQFIPQIPLEIYL